MNMWTKADWRKKPRVQMPDYKNIKILKDVENQLEKYPPLVFAGEARKLKQQLGKVANGQGFLLQACLLISRIEKRSHFRIMAEHTLVEVAGQRLAVLLQNRSGRFNGGNGLCTESLNCHRIIPSSNIKYVFYAHI